MKNINLVKLSNDMLKRVRGGAEVVTCCTCTNIKNGVDNYTTKGKKVILPTKGAD